MRIGTLHARKSERNQCMSISEVIEDQMRLYFKVSVYVRLIGNKKEILCSQAFFGSIKMQTGLTVFMSKISKSDFKVYIGPTRKCKTSFGFMKLFTL